MSEEDSSWKPFRTRVPSTVQAPPLSQIEKRTNEPLKRRFSETSHLRQVTGDFSDTSTNYSFLKPQTHSGAPTDTLTNFEAASSSSSSQNEMSSSNDPEYVENPHRHGNGPSSSSSQGPIYANNRGISDQFSHEFEDDLQGDASEDGVYATNPYLDEMLIRMVGRFKSLVAQGVMPAQILKVTKQREGIIQIMRRNRGVVASQLERRLFGRQRPTRNQIEQRGIVPLGYFSQGYEQAMRKQHRRRQSTLGDMQNLIKLRPAPETIVKKGVVHKKQFEKIYEMAPADSEDEADDTEKSGPWEVSLLHSLLFLTIQEALKKSCLDCQRSEQQILSEMEEITKHLKKLRDDLDKYDLSNILEFEKDEEKVRLQFTQLQMKLMSIGSRQQKIHQKLTILHGVEKELIEVQNRYDQKLGQLRRNEEQSLEQLKQKRAARDRALRIMYAERSHQNWAMAKLNYTIFIAEDHNRISKLKLDQLESDEKTQNEEFEIKSRELANDKEFVGELKSFLHSLRTLSEHQNTIVKDFETAIENWEAELIQIRHEMSKVRRLTFKRIYALHRSVEIADNLDLGFRRLSVATASEIERERRHHATKIQRQLLTLYGHLKQVNINVFSARMNEIIDVQMIMSDGKLKSFFSVFCQVMAQTLIDVELVHRQFNSNVSISPNHSKYLSALFGIESVMNVIGLEKKLTMDEKLHRVMIFLNILKNAVRYEENAKALELAKNKMNRKLNTTDVIAGAHAAHLAASKKNQMKKDGNGAGINENDHDTLMKEDGIKINLDIKTTKLNGINIFIGRKLCADGNMQSEIDKTPNHQVPRLAEIRCRDLFEIVVNGNVKIFHEMPRSSVEAAKAILRAVWRIDSQSTT